MPVVTLDDVNKREQSWKQRNCPGATALWSFSWNAYTIRKGDDKLVLFRRTCMWLVLVLRTIHWVFAFVTFAKDGPIAIVLTVILGLFSTCFMAWCLAMIGETWGERKVFGRLVGRTHFDILLGVLALGHVVAFASMWFQTGSLFAAATLARTGTGWTVLWLAAVLGAWICTWRPEETSQV